MRKPSEGSEGQGYHFYAVGNLDSRTLDEARKARLENSLAGILSSLTGPMSILVRRRRYRHDALRHDTPHSPFDVAVRDWMAQQLDANSGWRHEIILGTVDQSEQSANIATRLSACGVKSRPIVGEDLQTLITDLTTVWSERWNHVQRGRILGRAMALSRLPGLSVDFDWLGPVFNVAANCDLVIVFEPIASNTAMRMLQRKLRDHTSSHLAELQRDSLGDAFTESAIDNIGGLRQRLASAQSRPLMATLIAVAWGTSPPDLAKSVSALETAFMTTSTRTRRLTFSHREALALRSSPDTTLRVAKLIPADAAATLHPFFQADVLEPSGYVIGRSTQSGLPVCFDPFDATIRSNANIGVFAASGQGKSFAVSTIVIEASRQGRGAIVVDPEGEYRSVVERIGGNYVELLRTNHGFKLLDTSVESPEVVAERFVEFSDLLVGGALGPANKVILSEQIHELLITHARSGRDPKLEDCVALCARVMPNVASAIDRLRRNGHDKWFDADRAIKSGQTVGFGLRGVPEELVPALTFVIASWIWGTVVSDPRPRHVVFDEVGALSEHAAIRRLLVQLARRCRKYQAGLIVATQNVQDLIQTSEGGVVASNCATVLLGGHRALDTQRMENAFGLTHSQRIGLEAAPRGRFLLISGEKRLDIDVTCPPLYEQIIHGGPIPGP